ncbi:MAG: hypothetical protein M5U19_06215 [Microthrixaceae bacterium]|nr:hypothetical protein [Microthrixaceae bacterium]
MQGDRIGERTTGDRLSPGTEPFHRTRIHSPWCRDPQWLSGVVDHVRSLPPPPPLQARCARDHTLSGGCRNTFGASGRHGEEWRDGTPHRLGRNFPVHRDPRSAHARRHDRDLRRDLDGGRYSFDSIKEHIRQRLHLVPPFRRRLVQVPFQFHHPVWIEDPNFNLDYHVRRIGCPAPGGRRELAEVAAQIASIPLDRTRPLWEAWVIEGLRQDRIGFVVKVHHSAIDGASGAEIMTEMYDLTPEGRELDPQPVEPERIPTDQELITYAAPVEATPGEGFIRPGQTHRGERFASRPRRT